MIEEALKALKEGKFILLYDYDNREAETDLVIAAEFMTPQNVYQMRRDAGGLMCVAIDPKACDNLGLPYYVDMLKFVGQSGNGFKAIESICEKEGDISYDRKSSFALWVNHRKTYTGIPDCDRCLTINELAKMTERSLSGDHVNFGSEFRSPGHVPLLRAAPHLLADRKGQTELSIVLARAAGVTPTMVVCEMLDGATSKALTKADAKTYAKEHGLVFVEGKEVEEKFKGMKP
jgi:3,4-dihydroxy 2-butanone 4-phosphate synthase